jgi:DNA-binding protein H-NS
MELATLTGILRQPFRKEAMPLMNQASLLEPEAPPAPGPIPTPAQHDGELPMSKSLEQMLAERAALDAEIAKAQAAARDTAFSEIQRILENTGISISELHEYFPLRGGAVTEAKTKRAAPVAKYQDPNNRESTWSGRGRPAKWLKPYLDAGRKLEEFLIQH